MTGGRHAPGASIGLREFGGTTTEAAIGIGSHQLVGVGSTTKVMTATMVMQHVEEGAIRLDDPVVGYLEALENEPWASTVTVRHLLTHTSGIDCGDDFTDTGIGADSVARFVECCVVGSRTLHPPGAHWSYNNCGFILLGRILEVLEEASWEEVLLDRVVGPLGLGMTTTTLLDESSDWVMGHRIDSESGEMVEEPRFMAKAGGPAGSNLMGTARDLLDFAEGLIGPDPTLLSPDSAQEMTRPQFSDSIQGQGLAWWIPSAGHVSHPGSTRGTSAYLHVKPSTWALAVVANGPGAHTIGERVLREVWGGEITEAGRELPTAVGIGVDIDTVPGIYDRRHVSHELRAQNGDLYAHTRYKGAVADFFDDPPPVRLQSVGDGVFESEGRHDSSDGLWEFVEVDEDGRPLLLRAGNRLHRRRAG